MLGHKLSQRMRDEFEIYTTIRGELDKYIQIPIFEGIKIIPQINVENIDQMIRAIKTVKPDVIINAIGIIKQLPVSKNIVKTIAINSLLPHQLASFTTENNIRLINISTDCVFNGKKGFYNEADFPDAEDLYGKSKNLGEVIADNCITLRTSIIGRELFTSHSLVEWFLSMRGKTIRGYLNAIYTGFPTLVLADILKMLLIDFPKLEGLFHVSSNKISKYELLKLINNEFQTGVRIEPFAEFYCDRSLNSAKFKTITGYQPPEWTEMIKMLAEDGKLYENWRK